LLDNISGTVFTTGNNAYPHGRPSDYLDCYQPHWGRHLSRTRPVPGSHDYRTAGAIGYFGYFGPRAGTASQGYYSYRLGSWLILALNSEIDTQAGSVQTEWVRAQLASSGSRCTAAVFHRPRFSSGPNGDNPEMADLWRVLVEHRVDVVLNGRDHLYERFAPQDADGRPDPAGIRQFTVGTGGVGLFQAGARKPNSDIVSSTWGVLKLTLLDDGYQWEFVPVEGEIFRDSGMGSCG
jgi:hypothetical protein